MSSSTSSTPPTKRDWWRDAVVYQVYPRSFADADGDGIGDLDGIRSRLPYLIELGVDGLWLSPCYPSPQADHGYDVADYTDIEPDYGTLDSFDALLADAHARGLKLLMDLVPNHCSSAHPWFQAALASAPGSAERARFLFRDGRGPDGSLPPNNWRSVFGGSAWTRVEEADGSGPGQWYLHLFDTAQPDFDWSNPDVGDLFEQVLRFWFDRGVDGFRIDVAHGLVKDSELPDWEPGPGNDRSDAPMWNQEGVHAVYRRWRAVADSYVGRDLTLVGEIWVPRVSDLALYLRPDELPQAFYFDLLTQPWRAPFLRAAITRGLQQIASTGAAVTWTLSNHDVHRTVTRYGQDQDRPWVASDEDPAAGTRFRGPTDLEQGTRFARSAILMLLALPGSAYLYQGEELGLPEVMDLADDARQDPIWRRTHGEEPGRDGSRVPLPWSAEEDSFGFSAGAAESGAAESGAGESGAGESAAADGEPVEPGRPWLPQPYWFAEYAVDVELSDPLSMLSLYRRALTLRRTLVPGHEVELAWVEVPGRDDILAFARGDLVCAVSCGDAPLLLPEDWGEVRLASAPVEGRTMPAGGGVWMSRG